MPASAESVATRQHYVKQEGQQVFKFAVRKMYEICETLLDRHGLTSKDIKVLVAHQANRRIIDAVGERLGAKPEQLFVNLHKYGNTSAASVAIALDDAVQHGRIHRGDLVLLIVFGAGLTWGAAVIEW